MPVSETKGLRGLPGLNTLSAEDREAFMLNNADKLKQFRSPSQRNKAADVLYNNQQFISTFGQEQFDKLNDGSENAYNMRNQMLKEKVINDAFLEAYSPYDQNGNRDNNKGLGAEWEKYAVLPLDSKEKLLRSEWKTPEQMQEEQENRTGFWNKAIDFVAGEAIQQHKKEANDKIKETIYNDASDAAAKQYASEVSQAYTNQAITGKSDDDTKRLFAQEIEPNSYAGNLGVSEYASHYRDGNPTSEMEDFSIDDMRQLLAKKAVYEHYMSPEMASTALNNEAKRYIKEHQSGAKRAGLFGKDVLISAMSYTADKVNGLYNLGLGIADKLGEKPLVYVDDTGNVLDPNKQEIMQAPDGQLSYQDESGNTHAVHQEQVARTVLHNMGKNFDGSDASENWHSLNPQYWTRAEQFGTLDTDAQKQYEKLGSSPYKVAWDPNEESNLWYESFKMMSFGLADMASMFVPFGIGWAGRALSTGAKFGEAAQTLGKALDFTGKALGAGSRAGQVGQGLVGAGGIAYAYQRGAFQETLAKNFAEAEEAVLNKSRQEVADRYQNDEAYKSQIDALINDRAAAMKAEYLAQLSTDQNTAYIDENIENRMKQVAGASIFNELVENQLNQNKASSEYAALQQQAINEAGDAAMNTFWPEALKYALVNTVGFRKYLYSHPTSLYNKAARNFEGLAEKTFENGKVRMVTPSSKFLTFKDKAVQFGKAAGRQMWGGAWTNGSDDMMVDAAERQSEDSFKNYLHDYATGEATAETYGFLDKSWSYLKGNMNSLGQESTLNAALVGGLGSGLSANLHFTNLAHLATKEGRNAFKNNFQERYVRNDDGTIKRDENGKPVTEEVSWTDNWGERLSFFVQNGILSEYYGKKIAERELQSHADYVNNVLDDYDDFKEITKLVASDIAVENALNQADEKTARFRKGIYLMSVLDRLGNDSKDPATMSSVVNNIKSLIDTGAKAATDPTGENAFSAEETEGLLKEYYSQHTDLEQNDTNNQKALEEISKNFLKLREAADARAKALQDIESVEKNKGIKLSDNVKSNLIVSHALYNHWKDRRDTMRQEIGDTADLDSEATGETLIASLGSRANAQDLIKTYDKQINELEKERSELNKDTEVLNKKYQEAQKNRKEAKGSDAVFESQKALDLAKNKLDNAKQQENFYQSMIALSQGKKKNVEEALKTLEENAEPKVLTADEIFSLDVKSRARMLAPANARLYSKEQTNEINKLKQRLQMEPNALEKIQDIAKLNQAMATVADAYDKVSNNPEAAEVQFDLLEEQGAQEAKELIYRNTAAGVTNVITEMAEGLKGHEDTAQNIDTFAYQVLRRLNTNVLNIIDEENLLPQYKKPLEDAKEWSKLGYDIVRAINSLDATSEKKTSILNGINRIAETAKNKEELFHNLEQALDAEYSESEIVRPEDYENVLKKLEEMNYLRDATVIADRKKRKERQAESKRKIEEEKARAQEKAKKAEEVTPIAQVQEEETANAKALNEGNAVLESVEDVDFDDIVPKENIIEEQQKEQKAVITDEAENSGIETISKSLTLEEQAKEINAESALVETKETDASAEANALGEQIIGTNPLYLSGNAMAEYDAASLVEDGILKHRVGAKLNDVMNNYFTWLKNSGIHLQEIIDTELASILKENPHAKVKFMSCKDDKVSNHLFLVMDFDNKENPNITNIHNKDLGGVIDNEGKKYLIIGVAGYGDINAANEGQKKVNEARRELYNIIYSNDPKKGNGYGLLRKGRKNYFDTHPSERFRILENVSTEIVPQSLIPGYLVNQLDGDEYKQLKPLSEVLQDKQRNPEDLSMEDLSWGIQQYTKFLAVGEDVKNVMLPINSDDAAGNVFVLIPAGNGKKLPVYINPLRYSEMKQGQLYDRIEDLLVKLTAPSYDTRYQALLDLFKVFHLSTDGNNILLDPNNPYISFVREGDTGPFKTMLLDSNFNYAEFKQAFLDMNPRVNVTSSVLKDSTLLKQYDEAGALQTDCALLHTAGSSYSIYPIDINGNMIVPAQSQSNVSASTDSAYRREGRGQLYYNGNLYYYNADGQYVHSMTGEVIKDSATLNKINTLKDIVTKKLSAVKSSGAWDYYILDAGEHPVAAKVNRTTKEVIMSSEDAAKKLIEQVEEKVEAAQRKEAAKEKLEETKKTASIEENLSGVSPAEIQTMQEEAFLNLTTIDTNIWIGEQLLKATKSENIAERIFKMAEDRGEILDDALRNQIILAAEYAKSRATEEKKIEEKPPIEQHTREAFENESMENVDNSKVIGSTQTFESLMKIKTHKKDILFKISEKWDDSPFKMEKGKVVRNASIAEIKDFLRDKGVNVDAIGTTKEDIEAWIHSEIDCK